MKTLHYMSLFWSCHSLLPHMYVLATRGGQQVATCVCVCLCVLQQLWQHKTWTRTEREKAQQSRPGQLRPNRVDKGDTNKGNCWCCRAGVVAVAASFAAAASVVAVAAFGWCRAIRELQQQQQPRIVWTCRPETKVIAGKCCGQMFNMQKAGWRPLPLSHSSYFSAAFSSLLPHSRQLPG